MPANFIRTLDSGVTLGSREYFFLTETDGSRRSCVNEARSAEEKKITSAWPQELQVSFPCNFRINRNKEMICVISPGFLLQNALKGDGTSCLQILKIDKLPGKAVSSLIQGFTAVIHHITARLHSCIISNYYQFLWTYILKAFPVCSSSNRSTISTSVTSTYDLIHDRNLI